MTTRSETLRLAPDAISEGLTAAGISLREFCQLFDVAYATGRQWTYPEGHKKACAPPYWVTPVLTACQDGSFLAMAREARTANDDGPRQPENVSHAR